MQINWVPCVCARLHAALPSSGSALSQKAAPGCSRYDDITQRLQRLVDTQAGPQAPAGAPAGAAGAAAAPGANCGALGTGLGAHPRPHMVLTRHCSKRGARVWRRMDLALGPYASQRQGAAACLVPDAGASLGRPNLLYS